MSVWAVLAAAGRGERLGRISASTAGQSPAVRLPPDRPKAFAPLRGRPLLAGVLGGFATGTRLIGLALLPALAILLWRGRDARSLARLAPLLPMRYRAVSADAVAAAMIAALAEATPGTRILESDALQAFDPRRTRAA